MKNIVKTLVTLIALACFATSAAAVEQKRFDDGSIEAFGCCGLATQQQ
jgi:hypothetical protein